jgi:hypothetical protein
MTGDDTATAWADRGADVVGDELGVVGDGDRGSFACGADDLRARVGGVADRPHAGHAGAPVGVDLDQPSRKELALETCGEAIGVGAQRGPDEEGVARDGATVGEPDRSQAATRRSTTPSTRPRRRRAPGARRPRRAGRA